MTASCALLWIPELISIVTWTIVEWTFVAWSKVPWTDVTWTVVAKTIAAWHSKFDQVLISSSREMAAWTDVTWTNVSWTNVAWTDVAWTDVAWTILASINWPNPYRIRTILNKKFNKIWSITPEIWLPGQVSLEQLSLGQMSLGQMLQGQISRDIIPIWTKKLTS